MTRPLCPQCERPVPRCLCQWITPCRNRIPVLLLQHPRETHHPKNSAALLHKSLTNVDLQVGEQWPPEALAEILNGYDNRLLYPDTPTSDLPRPPMAPADSALPLRLIVLDATWRKSLKMLHLNPALQQLPRLPLTGTPASRYQIRKAKHPNQLSTLEATCHALTQLEQDQTDYQPLLAAFEAFNHHQMAFRPQ